MDPAAFDKTVVSAAIIIGLWLVRAVALSIVRRRTDNVRTRYWWSKGSMYLLVVIALFMVGRTWLVGFQSLTTFLGLVSAGLAIALKDLVVSLAGWIFIISRQPFKLGDRIQCGKHSGDVIDIGIFQFTLLEVGNWVDAEQSTGRIIMLPNSVVFTQSQANYTRGFQYIWNEIPVLVTFESNWEKARDILFRIIKEHGPNLSRNAQEEIKEASREFMIFYPTLDPTVYTRVADSGVLLTIRYICHPRHRRGSAEKIWIKILYEFTSRDDIDFAYPTQRFFNNAAERKKEAVPPAAGGTAS